MDRHCIGRGWGEEGLTDCVASSVSGSGMRLHGWASGKTALLEESPSVIVLVVVKSQMTPFKIEAESALFFYSAACFSSTTRSLSQPGPVVVAGEGKPRRAHRHMPLAISAERLCEYGGTWFRPGGHAHTHTPPREQSSADAAARYVIWVLSDSPTRIGVITRRRCPEERERE